MKRLADNRFQPDNRLGNSSHGDYLRHNFRLLGDMAVVYYQIWDDRLRKHKTRRFLYRLNESQLNDIGINREQRRREMAKWFWQD